MPREPTPDLAPFLRTQILVFRPGAFLEIQPKDALQALLPLMGEQAVGVRRILLDPFLELFLELTLAIFLLLYTNIRSLYYNKKSIACTFKRVISKLFFRQPLSLNQNS